MLIWISRHSLWWPTRYNIFAPCRGMWISVSSWTSHWRSKIMDVKVTLVNSSENFESLWRFVTCRLVELKKSYIPKIKLSSRVSSLAYKLVIIISYLIKGLVDAISDPQQRLEDCIVHLNLIIRLSRLGSQYTLVLIIIRRSQLNHVHILGFLIICWKSNTYDQICIESLRDSQTLLNKALLEDL